MCRSFSGQFMCPGFSIVKLVWKNVRKIRSREKQMELEDWMSTNGYDICAVSETGLNGDEYVEVGKN